ncbi:MAG: hypothetical protein DCF31_09710 [Alphaproteobacteria bacterium]|nr:MAG: hypothetical protein DCF31_09710 [Alphaproteobacteria bacterium]
MTRTVRLFVMLLVIGSAPVQAEPHLADPQLTAVFDDLQRWQAGLAGDLAPAAMATRTAELTTLQQRLQAVPVTGRTRSFKVDWLVVRSEMDRAEFTLKVTRPWARDPGYYLEPIQRLAFTDLPDAALAAKIAAIPARLAAARTVLDDVAADHADLAIRSLTTSDGVEDGYPARKTAPAGVIGWYRDLADRARTAQPALLPDIERAITALESYRRWLVDNRARMTGRAGVGTARLDWYLRHALQMPYDSRDALTLSQRELDRMWADLALEQSRNSGLPEIAIARTEADYLARVADTDARIRRFLVDRRFMTIPPEIPATLAKMVVPPYSEPINVPFSTRTPPNFWEQVQFRDPSPDHLHAVIPGHRMDLMLSNANPNSIRRAVNDGARWQGWAVYLEESALQAGFFDDRPRARELIYIFGLWRAARAVGDIRNQRNERTAAEVADWWQAVTPMLDGNVARKYAHIRTLLGHGLEYTIGNIQMWELLAARRRQLGDKFVLQDFHDDFIRRGRIPMALIRYEMLGDDSMEKALFERPPIPPA